MIHQKTVAELSGALQSRELSSVDVTRHFLKRIREFDHELNSFITVSEEEAIKAAQQADQRLAQGNASPLTGIPIAHKDMFCTQGILTTASSQMLSNFVPPYDATVVERLKAAGIVLLGKTNCDEFAMGSTNENSYFGPVKNPWDLETVPGGSSGGSAAAVAARLVPIATGTDTGGSVRQPASLSGITGLKPTYGRVSRHGIIAFASSFDQAGILAQTAEDIALILNTISGMDIQDSTSADEPVPDFMASLNQPLKGVKIGIPKEYFTSDLDPVIAEMILTRARVFEKLGGQLVEIHLPHVHLAVPAYYIIAFAECSSNLARYDGVRFGYRCDNPLNLQDLYERSRSEGFGEEVKHRIMLGMYVLSSGYYDAYYLKAQKIRRLISEDYQNAFKKVDLILSPTVPSTAFKQGSQMNDRIQMYLSDIFTVTTNLAGLPGISIPIGFKEGLPVGLQLMSNHFKEGLLLNTAHRFQQETDWHKKIPRGYE